MPRKKSKLDDQEDLDLLNEYEANPKSFKHISKKEEDQLVEAATKLLDSETKRITIRISEETLLQLKSMAIKEGLPYQTMIQSLLHKIVTEQYVPRMMLEDREKKLAKLERELRSAKAS